MAAPQWLGSEGVWFVALNAVVVAIAFLSMARPSLASPRPGGVTRRASSVLLQRLRSLSIFSYPSACLSESDTAATSRDTDEEVVAAASSSPVMIRSPSSSRALVVAADQHAAAAAKAEEEDVNEEEEGDPNAMSMDEAYALVVAARQRPEHEREQDARRSEVDAKAEEFIRQFKEDLRQQRLNSIINYTQMLKQRATRSRS